MIRTANPATGEVLETFDPYFTEEVDRRLALAHSATRSWRATSFAERAERMARGAELLTAEREELARVMTTEMGKPIKAAVAEAEKCATACRYYAEHAERMLARRPVDVDDGDAWVDFQPLGVVLAIMPWNFPFWQVFRFVAPALMAGNVGVLKHASNVPRCALAIEDILHRAGFPEGVFQTLLVGSDAVEGIITDPRVAAVTLTGSEAAGSSVGSTAGRVIKTSVLELGGSDPFVVMPSADLDRAVETAVTARMINNGQSCIAAKRFVIHRDIFSDFCARFVARVEALRIGDPMDEATEIGPLATSQIVDDLDDQVRRTVAAGARVLTGGERLEGRGNFYQPTVLIDVPRNSPAAREELFGPVAPLFEARDIDHALEIANDTTFGLGAAAWTNDAAEQARFVAELEAGTVAINGMVASDPRLPFGGIKRSGYGRELADFGIREFVNVKSVRTTHAAPGPRHASE